MSETPQRISIGDLLIATTVIGTLVALGMPLVNIAMDPIRFAGSLEHQTAGFLMLFCSFGLVGFPVVIGTAGFFALRKVQSPLKILYVILIIFMAVGSVPFAYVVARACAFQVVKL